MSAREDAVRAIRAGHDLHHGTSEDADLALLDGDRLYAEGLAALAADGDLEAVRVMAEVIAASAAALGAGDPAAAEQAWEQGLRLLGV
ncbi:MAG: hypothetical protein ACJ762_10765 [Solirubrobacteraceae bacterium]